MEEAMHEAMQTLEDRVEALETAVIDLANWSQAVQAILVKVADASDAAEQADLLTGDNAEHVEYTGGD